MTALSILIWSLLSDWKPIKYATTISRLFISPSTLGWLEPLLDRIARNSTTVVCPVIDVIDDTTLEFHYRDSSGVNVGGFDWNLQFSWHAVPEREKKRHNVSPSLLNSTPLSTHDLRSDNSLGLPRGRGGGEVIPLATTVKFSNTSERAEACEGAKRSWVFAVWHACLFKHMPLSSAVRVCCVLYVWECVCVCAGLWHG